MVEQASGIAAIIPIKNLANSKTFVIEVIPPQGAVLFIERTTPVVVAKYNDLT